MFNAQATHWATARNLNVADVSAKWDAVLVAYAKAEKAEQTISQYWFDQVGKLEYNALEEYSLLVEWADTIECAISAALSIRDFVSDKEFCKMQDECNMWLDYWQEKNA